MSDAWHITMNTDVNNYGWSTTVSVTNGGVNPSTMGFTPKGTLLSNSVQSLTSPGSVIESYSEAVPLIQTGTQTNLMNKEPITYVSIPKNRQSAWAYFSGNFTFPTLRTMQATDDYGAAGGWTAISILNDIMTGGSGSAGTAWNTITTFAWDADYSNFDYPIAYYRIAPYANLIHIFENLFPNLPTTMAYTAGPPPMVTAHLAQHQAIQLNTQGIKNITMRYVPRLLPSIMVHGGLGAPPANANQAQPTASYSGTVPNLPTFTYPHYWGKDVPGADVLIAMLNKGAGTQSKFSKAEVINLTDITTGILAVFATNIDTSLIKQMQSSMVNPVKGYGKDFGLIVERDEVLNGGMPLFTLTSLTTTANEDEILQANTGVYTAQASGSYSYTVHANLGSLISAGESQSDLHPVPTATVTATIRQANFPPTQSSPAKSFWILGSVSFKFEYYEEMYSSSSTVLDSTALPSSIPGLGRKTSQLMVNYTPYTMNNNDFDPNIPANCKEVEATKVDVDPKMENAALDTNRIVMFPTTVRRVDYHPIGATGYTNASINMSYNPVDGAASYEVQGGEGDSGGYISQLTFGPGSQRIKAHVGTGEPLNVNLSACADLSKATNYATRLLGFLQGYYEITETTKNINCTTPDFTYPTEKPGTNLNLGFVVSVNKAVTPSYSQKTIVYRYYQ